MVKRSVEFCFDLISPYSWLALTRAAAFAEQHGVHWRLRPVVYGAILDATGLIGPGEQPAKRRAMAADVARWAHALGLRFTGPPAHPFRSLEALRTVCLFADDPRALALSRALAGACWEDGRDLTDPAVLADVVGSVGLDAGDLRARIGAPAIKARLRQNTDTALAAGVFGVPTFLVDGQLFWGQDRLAMLADHLAGRLPPVAAAVAAFDARPRGTDRAGAPPQRRS